MSGSDLVPRPPGRRVAPDAPVGRRRRRPPPDMSGLAARPHRRGRAYADFMSAAERFVAVPPSRARTASGYLVCGAVLAFLGWSFFGHLTLFAVAPGEVSSRGGTQAVEPRVAGSVARILVADGAHVARGDPLVQLDATVEAADRAIIVARMDDLRAEAARRDTAVSAAAEDPVGVHDAVAWPEGASGGLPAAVRAREEAALRADLAELAATIADLRSQRAAKEASRDRFKADIAAEKALIDARTERTDMHQQLADKGWDSRATVLAALVPLRREQVSLATLQGSLAATEAGLPVIDRQIADARQSFVTLNTQKAATARRELDGLAQRLVKADQALAWQTLRAPVAGAVHALSITTVGQSVKAGQQIMQVVPDDAPITVLAYVLNADAGFVRAGQRAVIKVDSFPYTRYGTIPGRVVKVAPDAIPGSLALARQRDDATPETKGALSVTDAAQQTSDLVFPVEIAPDRDWIAVGDRRVRLSPGMSLAVEIETERQRVIDYVLYPLIRALPQR